MGLRANRLAELIGSKSALSNPVILSVAIIGALLTFRYAALTPDTSIIAASAAALIGFLLTATLLILARRWGSRGEWSPPRVGFVLTTLALTSIVRSLVTALVVDSRSGSRAPDANPGVRTLASLILTVVIGLIIAATVELARERASSTLQLLAEQQRLRSLAESMDEKLKRADSELRSRALALLTPIIDEIRALLEDEISESEAQDVSERIVSVVNEVVRPASRELAISPLFEPHQIDTESGLPRRVLADRMDVTTAIKPFWLLLISWGVLLPGPLLLGAQGRVIAMWFVGSLVIALLLFVIKRVWPPSLREMPVVTGLGSLFILYVIINVVFQILMARWGWDVRGSALWAYSNEMGLIVRVAIGMFVSILATLNVHGEQIRASLLQTNSQLQELIARIRRETWLLHRSMSLTVHGNVQSALVSTAMRLSAPGRTRATVVDARRRLDQALLAISVGQGTESTVSQSLEDLQGLWKSVVSIEFRISPEADRALARNAGLRQCVVEICREATSNAIRHGHATSVEMQIHVKGNLIEVHVVDNGNSHEATAVPGLGSTMFDDTCLRWSLREMPNGGSKLLAVLI